MPDSPLIAKFPRGPQPRRRVWLLITFAIVLTALCFRYWQHEPTYQSKPVSGWLRQPIPTAPATNDPAQEALSALGPRALPVLDKTLKNFQGADRYRKWWGILRNRTVGYPFLQRQFLRLPKPELDDLARQRALLTILQLGPQARSSAPILVLLLARPSDSHLAERALASLLLPPEELAGHLLECPPQTDGTKVLSLLLQALAREPGGARSVELLFSMQENTNGNVRASALLALGKLGPHLEGRLPQLTALLTHTNQLTRSLAAMVLGEMGPKARDAVGALQKLQWDSFPTARLAATQALAKINLPSPNDTANPGLARKPAR